jgi:hypothetical protein
MRNPPLDDPNPGNWHGPERDIRNGVIEIDTKKKASAKSGFSAVPEFSTLNVTD